MTRKTTVDEVDLDALLEVLTEGHLDSEGGYPYDCGWFGEKFFVAALDHDGATRLDVYTKQEIYSWTGRVRKYLDEHPDADWPEAVNETRKDAP